MLKDTLKKVIKMVQLRKINRYGVRKRNGLTSDQVHFIKMCAYDRRVWRIL